MINKVRISKPYDEYIDNPFLVLIHRGEGETEGKSLWGHEFEKGTYHYKSLANQVIEQGINDGFFQDASTPSPTTENNKV